MIYIALRTVFTMPIHPGFLHRPRVCVRGKWSFPSLRTSSVGRTAVGPFFLLTSTPKLTSENLGRFACKNLTELLRKTVFEIPLFLTPIVVDSPCKEASYWLPSCRRCDFQVKLSCSLYFCSIERGVAKRIAATHELVIEEICVTRRYHDLVSQFSYEIQIFHSALIKSILLAATHDVITEKE